MPNKEIIFLTGDNINSYVHLPYTKRNENTPDYQVCNRFSIKHICIFNFYHIKKLNDSTVLTTSPEMAEYITSLPFFVFKQLELTRLDYQPTVASIVDLVLFIHPQGGRR
ncbi:hypothetical protein EfmAA96_20610 [Enterococcus faecium]|nr:hypothetical protein EfmAA96_20610 [Enterococcus faecium]